MEFETVESLPQAGDKQPRSCNDPAAGLRSIAQSRLLRGGGATSPAVQGRMTALAHPGVGDDECRRILERQRAILLSRDSAPQAKAPRPDVPLASVVVLNYNGQAVLKRCLTCLAAQTYPSYEILVVDNGSQDGSIAEARQVFGEDARFRWILNSTNLGCPAGRNVGLDHASGEFVAFIDNDGFAHPNWLQAAVQRLAMDGRIGAVASVVFFDEHPLILNGAGGTMSLAGYGGDVCFQMPFEFSHLPDEVLYPMGCGMVCRRDALEATGRFDAMLVNYYDDVDLGIRLWDAGYRVVVEPGSRVDHGFSYSNAFNDNKVYLCERNRVRVALEYFPLASLLPWFAREVLMAMHQRRSAPALVGAKLKGWRWNIRHLVNTLTRRSKWRKRYADFEHLLEPSWLPFPWEFTVNSSNHPSGDVRGSVIDIGADDCAVLNYGWTRVQAWKDGTRFRQTAGPASLIFQLVEPLSTLWFTALVSAGPVDVCLRDANTLSIVRTWQINRSADEWKRYGVTANVPPGWYEMIFFPEQPASFATVLGLANIEFTRASSEHPVPPAESWPTAE